MKSTRTYFAHLIVDGEKWGERCVSDAYDLLSHPTFYFKEMLDTCEALRLIARARTEDYITDADMYSEALLEAVLTYILFSKEKRTYADGSPMVEKTDITRQFTAEWLHIHFPGWMETFSLDVVEGILAPPDGEWS